MNFVTKREENKLKGKRLWFFFSKQKKRTFDFSKKKENFIKKERREFLGIKKWGI